MVAGNSQQILIDYSKRPDEQQNIGSNDVKFIIKRLKLKGWKITINKESLTEDLINKHRILILFMPQLKFADFEFQALKQYLESGDGKILVLLEEGGERKSSSNINYFIEEYGTSVNNDKVIRTSFYKYYNPKEVLIQDGIINRSLINHASQTNLIQSSNNNGGGLSYLYPFGATLNVAKPSLPVLSTGKTSFPPCRPTCSFYEHETNNDGGRMIIFGSGHGFIDKYINKEQNVNLFDLFLDYLQDKQFKPNMIDALNPEINDYHVVPDLELLCNDPMLYLEESEELPIDYSTLFSRKIKKISNLSLAHINQTFNELQIEKRTLQVIKPHFETPLPGLQPAVYMPVFRAHTKPELELFDLDNEFASVQSKLAKLANKCNNNDIDYFICESGLIVGLDMANLKEKNICKHILYMVASKIVSFKKINND
ncbi:intraflagellar transport 52 [Dermatophagoides pteronyssinus]|uniref:intraflagellar transport 52 n=1 Tax=Dermatophagoides pteronyssinus TaxID=6956 RepID=UPI003F672BEC